MAAGNAKLMLGFCDINYAEDAIAMWKNGLGDHARAIHFCTGATPSDLQVTLVIFVKIVKGEEAVAPNLVVDETSIYHKLKQGPTEVLPSTIAGG